MINPTINISVAGENSLILYLADNADSKVAAQIQSVTALITESLGPMLIDIIPSYASILIIYDPHLTDHFAVSKEIQKAMTIHANSKVDQHHRWTVNSLSCLSTMELTQDQTSRI